jgi:adenine-specific DNA-methyltransferase
LRRPGAGRAATAIHEEKMLMEDNTKKTSTAVRPERVADASPDFKAELLARLRDAAPEAFAEGKLDLDKLKSLVGDAAETSPERYSFSWAGKRDAIAMLQAPTRATLAPNRTASIDFDDAQHVFIEGENLEVLKVLYRSYFGRVKLIYIDPPYNTGNDFVYPDNFADPLDHYLRITGQKNGNGDYLSSQTERNGRFHSSWLSMMYPRLSLARQLLREDGVLFVTIDDTEITDLTLLLDQIFGEENKIGSIVWQHSVQPKGYIGRVSLQHNYILVYRKSDEFEIGSLSRTEEHNKNYSNPDKDPNGDWRAGDVRNALYRRNLIFPIQTPSGKTINPPKNGWRWSKQTIQKKIDSGEIIFSADETRIIRKIYLKNLEGRSPESIWFAKDVGSTREAVSELKGLFGGDTPFDTPNRHV